MPVAGPQGVVELDQRRSTSPPIYDYQCHFCPTPAPLQRYIDTCSAAGEYCLRTPRPEDTAQARALTRSCAPCRYLAMARQITIFALLGLACIAAWFGSNLVDTKQDLSAETPERRRTALGATIPVPIGQVLVGALAARFGSEQVLATDPICSARYKRRNPESYPSSTLKMKWAFEYDARHQRVEVNVFRRGTKTPDRAQTVLECGVMFNLRTFLEQRSPGTVSTLEPELFVISYYYAPEYSLPTKILTWQNGVFELPEL